MNLSDEKLVAYLDGELDASESAALSNALVRDAAARGRLETLKGGGRAFAEAFDAMLAAAPDDKLQAMFAGLVAQTSGGTINRSASDEAPAGETVVPFRQPVKPQPQQARHTPLWRMAAAAVLLAAVFAGGVISGGILNEPQQVAEAPGWREAAARYVALFSKETLEGMPAYSVEKRANLAKAEDALGLQLTESRLSAPDLDFRGTQLLNFNGKPLAQIAYLHGEKPVALCIIAAANGEPAAPANETRHGLNIVHWAAGGYGYMLIGDVPEDELSRIAERFRSQFS
jgi:anti-sigma factor RsiW